MPAIAPLPAEQVGALAAYLSRLVVNSIALTHYVSLALSVLNIGESAHQALLSLVFTACC
jgi:hypothetical protein